MKRLIFICIVLLPARSWAQQLPHRAVNLGLSYAKADAQAISLSLTHNVGLGRSRKLTLGYGIRLQQFNPARTATYDCTCGKKVNMFSTTADYSLNLMLQTTYQLSERFGLGFNIDLVGFRFLPTKAYGRSDKPFETQEVVDAASTFLQMGGSQGSQYNLLLVGSNDIGQLNSEFFASFTLSRRFLLTAGLSHYLISYELRYEYMHPLAVSPQVHETKAYRFYNLPFVNVSYRLWQN